MCTGTNLGLGTSDLQLIYGALFEVRAKWRPIGLELSLTPGTLDAIEQMKINPSDRLEAVLLHWLRVTRGASWKQVIDALRSALVDEIQLAEKLELKYCPPGNFYIYIIIPIELLMLTPRLLQLTVGHRLLKLLRNFRKGFVHCVYHWHLINPPPHRNWPQGEKEV